MDIEYPPARSDDIDIIFNLSKELIDSYEDIGSIDYEGVLRWVRNKIENNIEQYIRVCIDGNTAGYYRLCPSDGRMELDDLYVLPDYRGRGIGTHIIRRCISSCCVPLFLYVFTANERAISLYERLGFNVTEQIGTTRQIMEREPDGI